MSRRILLACACLAACSSSESAGSDGDASGIDSAATDTAVAPDSATDAVSDLATEGSLPDGKTAAVPADMLDLAAWKLTLPVDTYHPGTPDEITQPELATFVDPVHFHLDDSKTAVVFHAECGGVTTSGSGYPRSELREMMADGKSTMAWSASSGTHDMIVREAITHLPEVKPDVVTAQIHDASDDVIEIRLRDKQLFVEHNGANYGTLNDAYTLGTVYTLEIRVTPGRLQVFYDGAQKVDRAASGDGWYFKAGAYTQSNTSKGDAPTAYGEVVIHELKVHHE